MRLAGGIINAIDGTHFNPRTREGCDPFLDYIIAYIRNFNPRTREGCDVGLPAGAG